VPFFVLRRWLETNALNSRSPRTQPSPNRNSRAGHRDPSIKSRHKPPNCWTD